MEALIFQGQPCETFDRRLPSEREIRHAHTMGAEETGLNKFLPRSICERT